MKNNKRYLIVGIFVLAGLAMIISILLWFSQSNRKNYDTYRITFHDSIDGVTTNSVVKYNGVEVGKVIKLDLDNDNPRNIYVYINITQGLHISTATYASIKPQGVTGMSYIGLSLIPNIPLVAIQPHNTPPYPEIPSKASFLSSLGEQAQSVTTDIKAISGQVKSLLNDKNIDHMSGIVANLDKVTSGIAAQSGSIEKSIIMVAQVLDNVNKNTAHLNDAIVSLAQLSKSLQQNSVSLDKVLNTVQDNTLRNLNTVFLPNLNQTISNMNIVTSQFSELIKTVNQNPSALVRGSRPIAAGPGE